VCILDLRAIAELIAVLIRSLRFLVIKRNVRSYLTELIEPTRKEPGCVSYELLQNRSDPTDFTFVEEWESDGALEAHLNTAHIRNAIASLAGLLAAAPDIRSYSSLR